MYTLITAASTAKAFQLKSKLTDANILLGDYQDLPELLVQSNKLIRLPNPFSETYAHSMLTFCLDKDIDVIYPLSEQELVLLLQSKQLFAEFNIRIETADDQIR